MSSAKSLTGGTGDVNPQWTVFNLTLTGPGGGVTNSVESALSTGAGRVPLGTSKNNKAVVMEILKVQCLSQFTLIAPDNLFRSFAAFVVLGTRSLSGVAVGIFSYSTANTVDEHRITGAQQLAGAAGAFQTFGGDSTLFVHDLTDGAGHGVLVASQNLYATLAISNGANAMLVPATDQYIQLRVLYRYKEVSLPEYLGIAQGQLSV